MGMGDQNFGFGNQLAFVADERKTSGVRCASHTRFVENHFLGRLFQKRFLFDSEINHWDRFPVIG